MPVKRGNRANPMRGLRIGCDAVFKGWPKNIARLRQIGGDTLAHVGTDIDAPGLVGPLLSRKLL
jgi:hypothetical protein